MKKQVLNSLIAAAALGAAWPAAAQTGRIAHYSHGGSAATLAAEQRNADNFGEPMPYFEPDSVRYLSSSMALGYGKWRWGGHGRTTDTLRFPEKYTPQQAATYTHQLYRRARLIGFDSVSSPARPAPTAEKLKRKHKRKAGRSRAAAPASSASLNMGAWVVLALAGAGWLLSGKKQPTTHCLTR